MVRPLCSALILMLAGCSAATAGGDCGDSFCLPPGAALLAKRTPVEDFNLYRVQWRGGRFLIYEGNAPDEGEGVGATLPVRHDPRAKLRRSGGRGSVALRMHPQWPNYLQVNGPCGEEDPCAVVRLARSITRR